MSCGTANATVRLLNMAVTASNMAKTEKVEFVVINLAQVSYWAVR